MDDTRLVAALKAGDRSALEEIYRNRFEDLCIYVSTLVVPEDAADIVQNVFWTIWKNRLYLPVDTDSSLFHYMLRSARNGALKTIRHDRVRTAYEPQLQIFVADNSDETVERFDKALLNRVHDLVETLPIRSREMLVLRWYHGYSIDRIASLMGISYGYARLLHSRALAMLRDRLQLP